MAPPVSRLSFPQLLAVTALYVLLMLRGDGYGLSGQIAWGAATGLYLYAFVRAAGVPGAQVTCAMLMATTLELLGSLGWGLYRYHFAAIPFYVPFGHGLFYALAFSSNARPFGRRNERSIVRTVVAAGTVYALASLALGRDQSGLVMWLLALLAMRWSRAPGLMAWCCTYTVLLEWVGTSIGTWSWAARVPFLGLASANPPSGVGIAYCLVDLLTVAICAHPGLARSPQPPPLASSTPLDLRAVALVGQ